MAELPESTPLLALNVVLAALVLLGAVGVAGGAIWEVTVRRRLRASLPNAWPPEADAGPPPAPPAPPARRGARKAEGRTR